MIIGDFLIRFLFFWIKIVLSCFFVLVLQVQVGSKSLEQWIEEGLKSSAVSRYFQQSAQAGVEVFYKKFPHLKGIAQNRIVKNHSIVEFHNGLLNQLQEAMEQAPEDMDLSPPVLPGTPPERLPAGHTSPLLDSSTPAQEK